MKKLTNYFFIALAAVALFTSCTDETDPVGPNITFKAGDGLTTGDETVDQGSTVTFSWEAIKGDANLEEFTIRVGAVDADGFPNTDIDKDQYEDTFSATLVDVGEYTFTFIATDKDGEQDIKTIVITTIEAAVDLNKYAAVLMGAQNAAEGSTASLVTGDVYAISGDEAKNNSELVDVVYYFGAKDAAIYSPSNSDIQGVTAYDIANWATQNGTKLSATSLTADDFDAIMTNYDLENAGEATGDVVGLLSVDDVVVFETADGKKGVFKVESIVDGASGSITIEVAVEQ